MGYYTEFAIQTKPEVDNLQGLVESEEDIPDGHVIDGTWYNCESVKWYDHEEDMKHLSKTAPGILFALRGFGENAGDEWIEFFKDGKMTAINLMPDFFTHYDGSLG